MSDPNPTVPLFVFADMYDEATIFKLPKEAFVEVDGGRELSHKWLNDHGYLDPYGFFGDAPSDT